jgi:LPXTG-motif cell wall-anchored protein
MPTDQIIIAVIAIAILGGLLAIWFRRRQTP